MTESEWLEGEDPAAMLRWVTDGRVPFPPRVGDRKLSLWVKACRKANGTTDYHTLASGSSIRLACEYWTRGDGLPLPMSVRAAILRDVVGNPWRPVAVRPEWLTPDVLVVARRAREDRLDDGTLDSLTLFALADALEEAGCEDAFSVRVSVYPHSPRGWAVGISAPELMPRSPRVLCYQRGREEAVAWAEKELGVHWDAVGKKSASGKAEYGLGTPNPILAHLRCPDPHYCGCWVVDLILGKG